MANNMAHAYSEIIKYDKNDDGTLLVYGKATDDAIDIDQQICDAAWLDRAMPEWFKSGGNIREQHSNIAAGVAQEYEAKADGHYIMAHVVDPVSVKKVENRVLKGFSIGIKSPRVVRDQKAANGRIIDGQIVEVSLVDRPANPNCQLVLAKSVAGESALVKAEDLIETTDSQESDTTQEGSKMEQIKTIVEAAKALTGDKVKFDHASYETARRALADLIVVEGQELGEGHDERGSLRALLSAVEALLAWREGEEWEGEAPGTGEIVEELKATAGDDTTREENTGEVCDKCGKAADVCKCEDKELVAEDGEETDADKSTEADEAAVESTDEVKEEAPAVDAEEDKEFVAEESDMSKALLADPKFLEVVETAVKSAIGKVETEVVELKSALEAAENKAASLESELAAAKSLAIGGGPKRSAIATGTVEINEWSVKGNEMLSKAAATPDTLLADGYRDLAKQYFAKSVSGN